MSGAEELLDERPWSVRAAAWRAGRWSVVAPWCGRDLQAVGYVGRGLGDIIGREAEPSPPVLPSDL